MPSVNSFALSLNPSWQLLKSVELFCLPELSLFLLILLAQKYGILILKSTQFISLLSQDAREMLI
jgi:hypothetical protein